MYIYCTWIGELTLCFCPQKGETALHEAASSGEIDVVRVLIEAKAKVNIESKVCTLYYHMHPVIGL